MRQPEEQTILIIAGSRDFKSWRGRGLVHWHNLRRVFEEMEWFMGEFFPGEKPSDVFKQHFSGTAQGADELGEWWAFLNGIETVPFQPDWSKGKSGGVVRNAEMVTAATNATLTAQVPPCLVTFWDGESRGTKDMIQRGENADFWVHVARF